MYICARCERPVTDVGAFLPGAESDFVCLGCFRTLHRKEPLPEGTTSKALINQHGVRHRPGPRVVSRPNYTVVIKNTAASKTRKKIAKKNLLAAKNLPPGSYNF